MTDVVSTAAALSSYGLWGVIAVLLFAVAHLYKEHNKLAKEMRDSLRKDSADAAKLLAEATLAIQNSTEAIAQIKFYIENKTRGRVNSPRDYHEDFE